MAAILRLEDQRILRELAPQPPSVPAGGSRRAPVVLPPPPPDLTTFLRDSNAQIRRRAALAVGRVGLREGVAPLLAALADPEQEVRQMAAFALGLIGDVSAAEALRTALSDHTAVVRGRAAEALGLIGDRAAAPAIGELVAGIVKQGFVAQIEPDDVTYPMDPAVEAFRLGLYALVRLKAYDQMASAVLDSSGQPIVRWWPVAYALQRVEDPRALGALTALARGPGSMTMAFAARGLGVLKRPASTSALVPLIDARKVGPQTAVSAIRALGQIGEASASGPLMQLLQQPDLTPDLRLEAVVALGNMRPTAASDIFLNLLGDPWPSMRAAALQALAQADPQSFITVLSGLDPDRNWSVRAALATALTEIDPEIAMPRLQAMLTDPDQRVIPSVLGALAGLKAPAIEKVLIEELGKPDFVIRMAAATHLGTLKPAGAVPHLIAAHQRALADPTYVARAAALGALARYGTPDAIETVKSALADKDWAVRVRAAELLNGISPSSDYAASIRPAPLRLGPEVYRQPRLTAPTVSPHVFLETAKGTIEFELAVLDAPLTSENFMTLARRGFFNGLSVHRVVPNFVVQDGDPRGDSEGGPGYTIRDELNELPYLRGSVGMALDWRDTGGSQFFITHSPQPHLDARYTVFGHVIAGMEVVDRLQQWDVIERVRIWDGMQMTTREP
ncbi:MAG: HEAT repeat domain-containing protein [Acidobacteria bacterium]|nr:HEAT repeat domain-containing protein [Acidobacteriota bacterium]